MFLVAAGVSLLSEALVTSGVPAKEQETQSDGRSESGIVVHRYGEDDCRELPRPPDGVLGLREYVRFPTTRDGFVIVRAAQLPFSRNEGFLYRQTPEGWVPNEDDFVLIRTPLAVAAGYTYLIAFGSGTDYCGPWGVDLVHPG